MDLIITNNKSASIPIQGTILDYDTFFKKATSEEGLDLDGDLYMDIDLLDEELYKEIKASFPSYKFFRLSENSNKPFVEEPVSDFFQKQAPQTSQQPYSTNDVQQRGMNSNAAFNPEDVNDNLNEDERMGIMGVLKSTTEPEQIKGKEEDGEPGRVILFGSSKGGTGKTFTCLISAYRYAKTHPQERIALADFDIIDGQVGISIHKVTPTIFNYYKQWKMGQRDFGTMSASRCQSERFPTNIDFYLAPKDNLINNDDFWQDVFLNLINNYDVVFFDSGIDYLNYTPISTLYKIADKIILVSTTSIKSVSSVIKQIGKLKGEINNKIFSAEDEIGPRLNLVLTQVGKNDEMNSTIMKTFSEKVPIIAVFGQISSDIQRAEFFGEWNIFDKNTRFNEALDNICK